MPNLILDYLRENGPTRSSEIVAELLRDGVAEDAARQRISRLRDPIKRLGGINLPNREAFLFIDGEYGSERFWHRLTEAMIDSGSAYGKAMLGLEARGGSVQHTQFPVASGLPVQNAKGHLLHSLVESKLLELRLIHKLETPAGTEITTEPLSGIRARRRAAIAVEDIVLSALRTWLIKMAWSSTNTVKLRDAESVPQFGQFAFDLVAPSYLASIRRHSNARMLPGYIVGDILLDRAVSTRDLQPFINKWDVLAAQARSTTIQPIFVADWMEEDALRILRAKGAFTAIPAVLFGEDAARDLRELTNTIENAAAAVSSSPNKVFELLARLSKLEGAAQNLRGVVIEMFVAHLFKGKGADCLIEIRKLVRDDENQQAEIDVFRWDKKESVCCECKGKSPGTLVGVDEIQEWMDTAVPRIKRWLKRQTHLPETKRFEFYSSTDYTDDARKLIGEIERSHRKQPIVFLTGRDVITQLQDRKESALVTIFREQFPHA